MLKEIIEPGGMEDGIVLATPWELMSGSLIGTCECGRDVLVPEEETLGTVNCEGCGNVWRVRIYPEVERL